MGDVKPIQVMKVVEMIGRVDREYQVDVRDYAGRFKNYELHVERYNKIVPERSRIGVKGKPDGSDDFDRWLDDNVPFQDYWGWLIKNIFLDVMNGEIRYWDLRRILGDEESPEWVKEITQRVHDEFSDCFDGEGGLEVEVSW